MSAEPIDLQHFAEISGDDPDFALELLQAFVEDTELRLIDMQRGIGEDNLPLVQRSAHHLRGSAGNIGCFTMQAIAKDMELKQLSGEQLTVMMGELQNLLTSIKAYTHTLTATSN